MSPEYTRAVQNDAPAVDVKPWGINLMCVDSVNTIFGRQ